MIRNTRCRSNVVPYSRVVYTYVAVTTAGRVEYFGACQVFRSNFVFLHTILSTSPRNTPKLFDPEDRVSPGRCRGIYMHKLLYANNMLKNILFFFSRPIVLYILSKPSYERSRPPSTRRPPPGVFARVRLRGESFEKSFYDPPGAVLSETGLAPSPRPSPGITHVKLTFPPPPRHASRRPPLGRYAPNGTAADTREIQFDIISAAVFLYFFFIIILLYRLADFRQCGSV